MPKKTKTRKRAGRIEVRESGVHGRGVYATKPIPKGARIIEYTGKRVLWENVSDDPADPHTFLFGLDNGTEVIDPTIRGNEARWINHSCDPNCEAIEEEDERVFIYALRDLQQGEELFYDYALQVDEPITREVAEESRCFCGSSRCRGTMLEQKNRSPLSAKLLPDFYFIIFQLLPHFFLHNSYFLLLPSSFSSVLRLR